MLRKFCHWFFGLCMLVGMVLIIGTAGSSDLNLLDWNTLLKQSGIAMTLVIVGFVGLKLSKWEHMC